PATARVSAQRGGRVGFPPRDATVRGAASPGGATYLAPMCGERLAAFAALLGVLGLGARPAAADGVNIQSSVYKLKNGMTVILSEDHSLPLVAVNISYNVGSRFEPPKRTGFAHLFEHLMFMGTERVPTGAYDAWMEAAGGRNNAWTSEDRTDYFDMAPKTG